MDNKDVVIQRGGSTTKLTEMYVKAMLKPNDVSLLDEKMIELKLRMDKRKEEMLSSIKVGWSSYPAKLIEPKLPEHLDTDKKGFFVDGSEVIMVKNISGEYRPFVVVGSESVKELVNVMNYGLAQDQKKMQKIVASGEFLSFDDREIFTDKLCNRDLLKNICQSPIEHRSNCVGEFLESTGDRGIDGRIKDYIFKFQDTSYFDAIRKMDFYDEKSKDYPDIMLRSTNGIRNYILSRIGLENCKRDLEYIIKTFSVVDAYKFPPGLCDDELVGSFSSKEEAEQVIFDIVAGLYVDSKGVGFQRRIAQVNGKGILDVDFLNVEATELIYIPGMVWVGDTLDPIDELFKIGFGAGRYLRYGKQVSIVERIMVNDIFYEVPQFVSQKTLYVAFILVQYTSVDFSFCVSFDHRTPEKWYRRKKTYIDALSSGEWIECPQDGTWEYLTVGLRKIVLWSTLYSDEWITDGLLKYLKTCPCFSSAHLKMLLAEHERMWRFCFYAKEKEFDDSMLEHKSRETVRFEN